VLDGEGLAPDFEFVSLRFVHVPVSVFVMLALPASWSFSKPVDCK
jgi:hypothetical protein